MRKYRKYWFPSILSILSGLVIGWFGGDPELHIPDIVVALAIIVIILLVFMGTYIHMKQIDDMEAKE